MSLSTWKTMISAGAGHDKKWRDSLRGDEARPRKFSVTEMENEAERAKQQRKRRRISSLSEIPANLDRHQAKKERKVLGEIPSVHQGTLTLAEARANAAKKNQVQLKSRYILSP